MREKHRSAVPMRASPRDPTHNLGMCPDWGSNPQHFGVWDEAPSNWATQPGLTGYYSPVVFSVSALGPRPSLVVKREKFEGRSLPTNGKKQGPGWRRERQLRGRKTKGSQES